MDGGSADIAGANICPVQSMDVTASPSWLFAEYSTSMCIKKDALKRLFL